MPDEKPPRLKSNWLHILIALAGRDLHGSGIVRDVLDQTGGALRLWPATLYSSLEAMTEAGLIRELADEEHPEGVSERRRYYRILPPGREVVRREASRLASLAALAIERAGSAT